MVVWPVDAADQITLDSLAPVHDIPDPIDLLLVGCGPEFSLEPAGLRAAIKDAGIGLEWMDTGAACRTYNVLVGEDRRVVAALIAV